MRIEIFKTDQVLPYPLNNRKHDENQVTKIAESITQFGFNQPIVVDEKNEILVGHGRLLAAKKLKLATVPVYQLKNLTETQKKTYRILDNKIQNDSTWEFENLGTELELLKAAGVDFETWGLNDLQELFPKDETEAVEDEFESEALEAVETQIKFGDLIELGKHRVLCGDSFKEESYVELLQGKLADLVTTDPPYGMQEYWSGLQSFRGNEQVANDTLSAIDVCNKFWPHVDKYTKETMACYVWFAMCKFSNIRIYFEELKYKTRATLIWVKENFNVGRADYHSHYEPCLYATKTTERTWNGERDQSDIWDARKKEQARVHPTQKPVSLIGRQIKNSSNKGEIVLDPFLGSGTSLIAAEQLDRICYGIELEPKYCQIIINRYRDHCEEVKKEAIIKINGDRVK